MLISVSKTGTFVPEWRGNKALQKAEQISVDFTYMTGEQEERFSTFKPVYHRDGDDVSQDIEVKIETNSMAIWQECVTKVHGLKENETHTEISAPADVAKIPGIYGLITEVVAHIKRGIEVAEAELKN